MIPDFNKPLPAVRPTATPPVAPGPGFTTNQYAQPAATQEEQRVSRLEQIAFGSAYPEHELDDRLEHLETEVLGQKFTGGNQERIARLEAKLSGQGAFAAAGATGSGGSGGLRQMAPPPVSPAPAGEAPPVQAPAGARQASTPSPAAQAEGTLGSADYAIVVQAIPVNKGAGDYLAKIQKYPGARMLRWSKFPVRVRLPKDSPQSWLGMLDSGVKKWGQYIPMKVVGAGEAADIDVTWVNHLAPRQLGITRISQIVAGTPQIIIFMLRPTYYQPEVPEKALQGAFLHEVGHSLGILGHSDSTDDIMQPFEVGLVAGSKRVPKTSTISHRDVNTLKRIYESPGLLPTFNSSQPADWACTTNDREFRH